jgi:hypothetical protein
MLADKILQFNLPTAHTVRVPAGEAQALYRNVLLGRAAIFGHEENNGHQESQRADYSCVEGGDGREEPTSQLHTRLDGEVI